MLDDQGNRYPRDPRYVCQKAEQHLASLKLGGYALFMPELEFYLLDGASYGTSPGESFFSMGLAGATPRVRCIAPRASRR